MARLSHPNVVTVFEARARGEEVFLVMELIVGRSLRELTESRPGWRVLLDRFCDAGRGLAAAHDAGLVHRDFKPDNALLGDDGRVCVTDFGLAQPNRASRPSRAEPAGTPGYIAPELWLGQAADPRSDQFSFCVFASGKRSSCCAAVLRRSRAAPPRAGPPRTAVSPSRGSADRRAAGTAPPPGACDSISSAYPSMPLLLLDRACAGAGASPSPRRSWRRSDSRCLAPAPAPTPVWLDARATPELHRFANRARAAPAAIANEPAFSSSKIPSLQAWRNAEQFSRESFSRSGSPELGESSGASTSALALNTPAVHPRVPRGTRSPTSPASRTRAVRGETGPPPSTPRQRSRADLPARAAMAGSAAAHRARSRKAARRWSPESDPLSGTRALR